MKYFLVDRRAWNNLMDNRRATTCGNKRQSHHIPVGTQEINPTSRAEHHSGHSRALFHFPDYTPVLAGPSGSAACILYRG